MKYYADYLYCTVKAEDITVTTKTMVIRTDGHKEAKSSQYGLWCDTWLEAQNALIDYWDAEHRKASGRLLRCSTMIAQAQALTRQQAEKEGVTQ